MIRCLVVDDEQVAREHMVRLLEQYSDVTTVGSASNGVEALESIADFTPDVVFLDIEMPEMSGFDVLAQLRTAPLIVFATAYDEYAVQAFEANAIDYLLKPVQPGRLTKTIEKIRTTLEKPAKEYESLLRTALSQLRPGAPAKLAARQTHCSTVAERNSVRTY